MATRTNIHFNHGKTLYANIYRHDDGYPGDVKHGEVIQSGVLADLLAFFRELKQEVLDTRMDSAEYLAAKFLVWQAKQYAKTYKGYNTATKECEYADNHYLDFLSVAPCIKDHGDIEFVYEIDCDLRDASGFPAVRWKEIGGRFKTVYLTGEQVKAA